MLTIKEGLKEARKILGQDGEYALPQNLSDELLLLIVKTSEEFKQDALEIPTVLTLHLLLYEVPFPASQKEVRLLTKELYADRKSLSDKASLMIIRFAYVFITLCFIECRNRFGHFGTDGVDQETTAGKKR